MAPDVSFTITGQPVAWARAGAFAGINATGKPFVRMFTRESQRPYRALIVDAAKQAMNKAGVSMMRGPISMSVVATFARPRSHFTSRGALVKSAPIAYTRKPDLDNLWKIIGDALSQVLWEDDAQIVSTTVTKDWGTVGCMTVEVSEL